ncbi:MAG: YcgN family cysteine cluster protein [Pseudomonadota bacterium]
MKTSTDRPFWERKSLSEMSRTEWESLCDGCARCCLIKLEDEETGVIDETNVACFLLDGEACRCRDYENRQARVPDCVKLTPETAGTIAWMPPTCAYRLLAEGKPLYWWHPLVSGDPATVHHAGVSVQGKTVSEKAVRDADLEDHIYLWPCEGAPDPSDRGPR